MNLHKNFIDVLQLAGQVDSNSTITIVYYSNTIKNESLSFINLNQKDINT